MDGKGKNGKGVQRWKRWEKVKLETGMKENGGEGRGK